MEIKPVIAKKPPEYPTEYLFINNPELFKRYIPLRWYKSKLVCTALSVFIVAGTTNSCSVAQKSATEVNSEQAKVGKLKTLAEKKQIAKVAPIFSHGKGSGAVGCIVTSPPVFISESEAMEIIIDAFRKENITFDSVESPKISFKAEAICDPNMDSDRSSIDSANVSIYVDGINLKHNLVIEYISSGDASKFQSSGIAWSSLNYYKTKECAEIFREVLEKEGKYNAAIFYDPLQKIKINRFKPYGEYEEKAKAKAKKMLESQVHDFINWVKREGIIK